MPIMFRDEWIWQNNNYRFNSIEAINHGALLYTQLMEIASWVISINIFKFDVEIKFQLKTSNLIPSILIMIDDNIDYF